MKTLLLLSLSQTILLLVLSVRLLFSTPPATQVSGHDSAVPQPVELPRPEIVTAFSKVPAPPADLTDLRKIIREEIAVLGQVLIAQAQGPVALAEESLSEEEPREQQKVLVEQRLLGHIADGYISDADMTRLQQKIAQLDVRSRKEMLGRLARALQSGELEGRF